MKQAKLIKILLDKFVYLDNDNKRVIDWCNECDRPICQIEISEGEFGCEYCKHSGNISCDMEVTE